MGYYSDVGLCLTAHGKLALDAGLATAQESNAHFDEIATLLNHVEARTDADSSAVAYMWENTKWYDDFPEVRFIEDLLQKLESREFLFIRVGEDSDDTEIQGSFWGNPLGMRLVRSIAFSA